MPTKSELMHYRLQAWLRENQCDEFEYLGKIIMNAWVTSQGILDNINMNILVTTMRIIW